MVTGAVVVPCDLVLRVELDGSYTNYSAESVLILTDPVDKSLSHCEERNQDFENLMFLECNEQNS